jgi:hypothetical protein
MKKAYKKKVKNKGSFYETVSKIPRRLYLSLIHLLTYETGSKRPRRLHLFLILLGLEFIYFLTRVPNLCDQPIFGDEAVYIRWAQIIAENPKEWLFVPKYRWQTAPFYVDKCLLHHTFFP